MIELPDSETLYAHFLAPWIPAEKNMENCLRADLEQIELDPGAHIRVLQPLPESERPEALARLERIQVAARSDLPGLLGVKGEPSESWLDALETWLTPERLRDILRSSNPRHPDNNWLLLCCETGALIALLLQARVPELRWLPDSPYFQSTLFDLNARVRIPVFHWAARTLSGDERHPLRDKISATVAFLRKG